jgi:geranylgeranyl diphosphate synthase, type I
VHEDGFSPSLEELRSAVDEHLNGFLSARVARLPETAPLVEEIASLIASGGKRLRPCFCYWGHRAAGGRHGKEIVAASSALELLHSFAIVHDDIMDGAQERRGRPTVFARRGLGFALLVGDLALVLADDAYFHSGFDPARLHQAFGVYSRMRQEVIAGQLLDAQAQSGPAVSEAEARRIALLKSGRYTVVEPLLIGAHLAEADEDLVSTLESFGVPLGEAFQLRDDLLGIFGDPSVTGKPADSDIREGKRHLLYAKAMAALRGRDRELFVEKWGAGSALSDQDVATVRSLVESSGAASQVEQVLQALGDEAARALAESGLDEECVAALEALMRLSIWRER